MQTIRQRPSRNDRPIRTCAGCKTRAQKSTLIRIARRSDGEIAIDHAQRFGGRGGYLCPSSRCLELSCRRKGLDRVLRATVPDDVVAALVSLFGAGPDESSNAGPAPDGRAQRIE